MPGGWTFAPKHGNVFELRFHDAARAGWEQYVLLASDQHWDNAKCDRELLKRHYDEAAEHGHPILSFGDALCAMQGKGDPRACYSELMGRHARASYFDTIVDDFIEWHRPYRGVYALHAAGNHETKVLKHHGTDLVTRCADGIRRSGGICRPGGFSGYVVIRCAGGPKTGNKTKALRLAWHHGWGGGGWSGKGVPQFAALAEQAEADIYFMGHIHRRGVTWGSRFYVSTADRRCTRRIAYVRGGAYKDDAGDGSSGWHVERGQGPRPLGGWWLRLWWHDDGLRWDLVSPE